MVMKSPPAAAIFHIGILTGMLIMSMP